MNENETREKVPAEAVKETAMPMAVLTGPRAQRRHQGRLPRPDRPAVPAPRRPAAGEDAVADALRGSALVSWASVCCYNPLQMTGTTTADGAFWQGTMTGV